MILNFLTQILFFGEEQKKIFGEENVPTYLQY